MVNWYFHILQRRNRQFNQGNIKDKTLGIAIEANKKKVDFLRYLERFLAFKLTIHFGTQQ